MKWLLAMVTFAGCAAAAFSRLARIARHRRKGGPLMRRRIYASTGLALGCLGWAGAVLLLVGAFNRSPALDWFLLVAAAVVSVFMGWTLMRADSNDTGGDVAKRQAEAKEQARRIREGLPPTDLDE